MPQSRPPSQPPSSRQTPFQPPSFHPPADAAGNNWVDRFAPDIAKPYLRLIRADRPVGVWLLLLPCWHGLGLAVAQAGNAKPVHLWYAVLFGIGAYVMRGAGCAYNDIIDRDIDGKVDRTSNRPLPSGQLSLRQAWAFLIFLCCLGLVVLVQFNANTVLLGLASLLLIAIYPFAKRITWWPQAWLGLTFNWGALVGYASITGTVALPALALYVGGIAWTLGYDTIYAHQDREDDALIGVKSSARRLGPRTRPALVIFYGVTLTGYAMAIHTAALSPWLIYLLLPAGLHLAHQAQRLDINDGARCLTLFQSNREAGFLLLAPMLLAILLDHTHL